MPAVSSDLDLWPVELRAPEQMLSPRFLLEQQAGLLEKRMNGIVRAQIVLVQAEDRVGYQFQVSAPELRFTSTLFEVTHRPELVYPCTILPPAPLPDFLQPRVYVPGYYDDGEPHEGGHWEENEWLASSQDEFIEKLRSLLRSPEIISTISSLVARTRELTDRKMTSSASKSFPNSSTSTSEE